MKRTDPKAIGEIINGIISDCNLENAYAEQKACFLWPQIVGQGINRLTTRRFVANGVMHVFLTSAPLKNELRFTAPKLIEAINSAVGTNILSDIVFH
ncbi:MAG: DUF721 domain-containing protein [Muribaculaceae bacterium]|nr:DUF721 domain-containing protein [Muribaculaceae bacterium]